MIFTDKFVYVHEPKTGGTFVTRALFQVHGASWTLLDQLLSALGRDRVTRGKYGTFVLNNNKHGGCNQIPASERGKKVLATVRNPLDLYVSQYEFGWWRRKEFLKYYRAVPGFERDYPRFPELSFGEYVRLSNHAFGPFAEGRERGGAPGLRTREFVSFYFKDPPRALARLDREYIESGRYRADMHDLHFLRTDDLNRGLHQFLAGNGYEEADISFIPEMGRVLPQGKGRRPEQKWERYYSPELKQWVREREWALFALFPEWDA